MAAINNLGLTFCLRIRILVLLASALLTGGMPLVGHADTTNLPYANSQVAGWLPGPVATNVVTGLVSNGLPTFGVFQIPARGLLSLQPGFSTNGLWSYQPFATNSYGSDYFLFTVADSHGTVSAPGTVSIVFTNMPYAYSQSVNWLKGATLTNTLQGYVAAGVPYFVIQQGPINGQVVGLTGFSTNGLWQYQPTNTPILAGADSFTFVVTDSLGNTSLPAVVNLMVTNLPYAIGQSVGWLQGAAPTNRLAGIVASGVTNFVIVQNPQYGQLVLQPGFISNGLWTYAPYATNFYGADSFTFKVQDSNGSNSLPAVVYISVTNVPVAPYAHYQYLKTRPGQALSIYLSGDDDGNDPLFPTNATQVRYAHTRDMRSWNPVFTVLTSPTNGTLSGTAPNLIYTPTKTNVFDSFTFKVNNGALDSAPATVMIKVAPYNAGTNYFDVNFNTNILYSGGTWSSGNSFQTNDVPAVNLGAVRPGLQNVTLSRSDDAGFLITNYFDRLSRPKLFNFFGTNYSALYIDNNGLISFGQAMTAFTGSPFPLAGISNAPCLAPLWADVDTTGGGGQVLYGLGYVNDAWDNAQGRPATVVTWLDVGYYSKHTYPLNRFQVTLIDRSDINVGDFDVEFNYEYVKWLWGDATSQGTYASAGFDNVDGINYYNLPQANNSSVTNLPSAGNVVPSYPGRYLFRVNNDTVPPIATNLTVSVGATNVFLSAQYGATRYGDMAVGFLISNTVSGTTTNITAAIVPMTATGLTPASTNAGLISGSHYWVNAMAAGPYGQSLANSNNSTFISTLPRLATLLPNPGTLVPPFTPGITAYQVTLANTASITLTCAAETATTNACLYQVNGGGYSANASLPLNVGANPVNVQVVSSYGTTNIYTIIVFRLVVPPTLTAQSVTAITTNQATLNALVNPNGLATTVYFSWGTNSAYGSTNTVTAGAGNSSVPATLAISNLTLATVYHYQMVASNASGLTSSGDLTFATAAALPQAVTLAASGITLTNVTFNGTVTANGSNATVYFSYMTATNLPAIFNPSFETNSFHNFPGYVSGNTAIAGWTVSDPSSVGLNPAGSSPFANNGATPNGSNVAFIQSNGATNTLATTISNLIVGKTYLVTFQANCRSNYAAPNAAWSLNGGSFVPFTCSPAVGGANAYYTNSAQFVANANTAALVLQNATTNDSAVLVDNFAINFSPPVYAGFSTTNTLPWGNTSVTVSNNIAGLQAATTYYYQVIAANSVGQAAGAYVPFTTPALAPVLVAQPVSGITSNAATVNAQVTPNGLDTTVSILWGLTSSYGNTNVSDCGSGNVAVPVALALTNLLPGAVYYYQIVAGNSAGVAVSGDQTFTTTPGVPQATTIGITNITTTGATLLGMVNPEGGVAAWYFQYGTSLSYGSFSTTNLIAAGTSSVPVSSVISGLAPVTTYHMILAATNSAGAALGGDLSFQTLDPLPPTLVVGSVTSLAQSNATLNAQVNPNGSSTTVSIEWGTSPAYGLTKMFASGAGLGFVPVSDALSNLALYTLYHYQIIASNAYGMATSGDLTFVSAYSPLAVLNWWRLGEADSNAVAGATPTTTIDSAGAENLTVHGGVVYSTNVSAAAVNHVAGSLSMDFTSGTGYAGGPVPTTVTTNFGFEMWVYPFSASGSPTLFYNGDPGFSGWGLGQIGNSYRILFGDVVFYDVGTVIPNQWMHIAVVEQGGIAVLYTNGVAAGSVAAVPLPANGSLAVGSNPGGGVNFPGLIDEVRIFTFNPGDFSTNYLLLNQPNGPVISGVAALNLSTNGAALGATIAPNIPAGATAGSWFEYGLTTNYGTVTATNAVLAGGAQSLSNVLTGLDPGTLYHFRADALGQNPPVQSSADQTFVTLDVPRTLSALAQFGSGQFSLLFTGGPSVSYTIIGSTNLALAASNWTVLGSPILVSNNLYQFTLPATNNGQYYRLREP